MCSSSTFLYYQMATFLSKMGPIDVFKPLSTVLSSTANNSKGHQDLKTSWKCWESNWGPLGVKRKGYLCAMQPPIQAVL